MDKTFNWNFTTRKISLFEDFRYFRLADDMLLNISKLEIEFVNDKICSLVFDKSNRDTLSNHPIVNDTTMG